MTVSSLFMLKATVTLLFALVQRFDLCAVAFFLPSSHLYSYHSHDRSADILTSVCSSASHVFARPSVSFVSACQSFLFYPFARGSNLQAHLSSSPLFLTLRRVLTDRINYLPQASKNQADSDEKKGDTAKGGKKPPPAKAPSPPKDEFEALHERFAALKKR